MKTKLKVLLPAVIALFALSAGYCDRDEDRYYVDRDKCDTEETQSIDDQGYDQGHAATEQHMLGAYNTPARIDVKGAWDFMVRASFIYWQALTHDTYFGQYNNLNNQIPANIPVPRHNFFADFDYDYHPGFKVGLGINSGHDNWNCYFDYTRFYMDEKGSARTTDDGVRLFSSWGGSEGVNMDINNEIPYAKWKLMMNVVDWSLGRPYYVGTNLTFRSFVGTKSFWNYERFYTNFHDANRVHYVAKNNTWGLGARGGLETNWIFGAGFRLFGNAAFSLNYQHNNIRRYKFSAVGDPAQVGENWVNYKDSRNAVVPVAEMALGLAWGTYFDDCSWHIDLSAGYEFQVWWDQNNLMAYSEADNFLAAVGPPLVFYPTGSPYNPTKLMLHGLTVQLKLDF